MDNTKLYRLRKGDRFIITMNSYHKQHKQFSEFTRVLKIESYFSMLKRCLKRVLIAIKNKDNDTLKRVFELFTRLIEIECIGEKCKSK